MNAAYINIRLYQMNTSKVKMSDDIGIDYSYLVQLLNGKKTPSIKVLKLIGNYIGADYNELLN